MQLAGDPVNMCLVERQDQNFLTNKHNVRQGGKATLYVFLNRTLPTVMGMVYWWWKHNAVEMLFFSRERRKCANRKPQEKVCTCNNIEKYELKTFARRSILLLNSKVILQEILWNLYCEQAKGKLQSFYLLCLQNMKSNEIHKFSSFMMKIVRYRVNIDLGVHTDLKLTNSMWYLLLSDTIFIKLPN